MTSAETLDQALGRQQHGLRLRFAPRPQRSPSPTFLQWIPCQAWNQQAYIKASNTEDNDSFGIGLSLAGDTLAVVTTTEASNATGVGGDQNDNSAANSGAVYLFKRTSNTWTQEAYIKASNATQGDFFGDSISLSRGFLVVGADFEDSAAIGVGGDQDSNSAQSSGAVYIFE